MTPLLLNVAVPLIITLVLFRGIVKLAFDRNGDDRDRP